MATTAIARYAMPLVEVWRLAAAFPYALSVEWSGRVLQGGAGYLGWQLGQFL